MTIHENDQDRENQTAAVDAIRFNIQCLPFIGRYSEVKETKRHHHMPYDFQVWQWGKCVGLGEVKCRMKYEAAFFERNGWFMDTDRLNRLAKAGKGYDVMLVLMTGDRRVFYVMLADLIKRRKDLKKKTGIGTDDHGKIKNDKEGYLIPFWMLTEVENKGL